MKRFLLIAILGFSACAHAPTLADMIKAGKYDYVEPHIDTKCLSVKPERFTSANADVIVFEQDMDSEQVSHVLDQVQLRPATIEELLAYGAAHPDVQRHYSVFALGSSCADDRGRGGYDVPYLGGAEEGRALLLYWVTPDPHQIWGGGTHFLVTPK